MARSVTTKVGSKTKSTLIPTNLCIKWGLYHVRRYRDKIGKVMKIDKEPMVEATGVNRIDMKKLQAGIDALNNPKPATFDAWQNRIEFHMEVSNLWDDDPDLTVDEDLKAIVIDYHTNDGE